MIYMLHKGRKHLAYGLRVHSCFCHLLSDKSWIGTCITDSIYWNIDWVSDHMLRTAYWLNSSHCFIWIVQYSWLLLLLLLLSLLLFCFMFFNMVLVELQTLRSSPTNFTFKRGYTLLIFIVFAFFLSSIVFSFFSRSTLMISLICLNDKILTVGAIDFLKIIWLLRKHYFFVQIYIMLRFKLIFSSIFFSIVFWLWVNLAILFFFYYWFKCTLLVIYFRGGLHLRILLLFRNNGICKIISAWWNLSLEYS